jgi:hypothetical protein
LLEDNPQSAGGLCNLAQVSRMNSFNSVESGKVASIERQNSPHAVNAHRRSKSGIVNPYA